MNATVDTLIHKLASEQRKGMIQDVRRMWPRVKEQEAEDAVDNATVMEGSFGSSAIVATIFNKKGKREGTVDWSFAGECPTCNQSVRFERETEHE
jgi:hypothetical protein